MRNTEKVIIRKALDYSPEIIQKTLQESLGPFGLQEMMNIKVINHDFSRKKSQIRWYPYSKKLPQLLDNSFILFYHHQLLYCHQLRKKVKALFSLLPHRSMIRISRPLSNDVKNIFKMLNK